MSNDKSIIHPLSLKVSVTSILVVKNDNFNDVVLVGYGPNLEVYKNLSLVSSMNVLDSTSSYIHGFQESPFSDSKSLNVIVYGGKNFSLVSLESSGLVAQYSPALQCEDWIFSVKWISPKEIILLTAHNRVLKTRISSSKSSTSFQTFHCEEKCILYSGCLVDHDISKVAVLAGTVFSELVIWCLEDDSKEMKVCHKLKGHEGVIFSVKFSIDNSMICTTSDDRTARLWKVQTTDSHVKWDHCEINCILVLDDFHTSRIFYSIFVERSVITFGEDSSFCHWNLTNGTKISWKRSTHEGAPLWSADVTYNNKELLTGGGDGALKVWDLTDLAQIVSCRLDYPKDDGDFAKIIQVFDDQTVLCLTHKGRLHAFHGGLSTKILSDSDLESYALMEIMSSQITFATLKGHIKVYGIIRNGLDFSCNLISNKSIFDGKIFSLTALNEDEILLCGPFGGLKIIAMSNISSFKDEFELPVVNGQRWVSSAVLTEGRCLIVGDRCGNVHVFVTKLLVPVKSYMKLHSRLGVSFLKYENEILWTVGRDGLIHTFRVKKFNKNAEVLNRISSTRTKFNVIEKIFAIEEQIFALGFHSDKMIIYNLTLNYICCEVPCGGSHRSWTTHLGQEFLQFSYLRDKFIEQIDIPTSMLTGSRVLKESLHSLEINSVSAFKLGNKTYFVTGSEDARLKILELDDPTQPLRHITTLDGHISSVKSIKIYPEAKSTFIISAGGRAQLIIWKATMTSKLSLVVSQMQSNLLKGNDKKRKKTWRDQIMINDAETRYMDVTIIKSNAENISVLTAGSDGVIRKFMYDIVTDRLQLDEESQLCESHAFLKIASCEDNEHFLTSDTRGNVALWSNSNLSKLSEVQSHLSGINSLHCFGKDIFTGGDDGALGWISFDKDIFTLSKFFLKDRAHSAHVTGLLRYGNCLFSSSVDQRISAWDVNPTSPESPFNLISQRVCHVPDVHDMTIGFTTAGEPVLVIVGAGIQLFQINTKT